MKDENKKIRLALLGFGNAGQAFAALLVSKREEIKARYGKDVQVTAIATASKGNLLAASAAAGTAGAGAGGAEEIDLDAVLADLAQHGRFTDQALLCELDTMEIVKTADYDVLIEMTPLNILSGRPAIDHIEAAFARGKHVITANKGPIAWKFRDLQQQALRAGCGEQPLTCIFSFIAEIEIAAFASDAVVALFVVGTFRADARRDRSVVCGLVNISGTAAKNAVGHA